MDLNSPPGPVRRGKGALWIAGLGLALVVAAAFVLTYDGLYAAALAGSVRPSLAFLYPMVFDGFLVVAFAAALVLRSVGLRATWYPWALIVVLLFAAAGANVLHAVGGASLLPPDLTRVIVAAVPPVALGLAFPLWLLMFAYVRGGRRTHPHDGYPIAETAGEKNADATDIVPGLRREDLAEETAPQRREATPSLASNAEKPDRPQRPKSSGEELEQHEVHKDQGGHEEEGEQDKREEYDKHEERGDSSERVLGSGLPFRRRPALPHPTPSATPPSGTVRSSPTPPDA